MAMEGLVRRRLNVILVSRQYACTTAAATPSQGIDEPPNEDEHDFGIPHLVLLLYEALKDSAPMLLD
jgi:hypothetical protein